MEGKTIFIVIGVLMIVLWTCREGLKGLRSGIVEKTGERFADANDHFSR